jgi:hypothetical protein
MRSPYSAQMPIPLLLACSRQVSFVQQRDCGRSARRPVRRRGAARRRLPARSRDHAGGTPGIHSRAASRSLAAGGVLTRTGRMSSGPTFHGYLDNSTRESHLPSARWLCEEAGRCASPTDTIAPEVIGWDEPDTFLSVPLVTTAARDHRSRRHAESRPKSSTRSSPFPSSSWREQRLRSSASGLPWLRLKVATQHRRHSTRSSTGSGCSPKYSTQARLMHG